MRARIAAGRVFAGALIVFTVYLVFTTPPPTPAMIEDGHPVVMAAG